ncbi:hypothetical protein GCM10010439_47370 [Actinocorallia aurantiaca]|uniref:Uncharacterized protein n=1 Tax=Actinocorallia aurantiaca TaxID=46204 RepID=A0ABP6GWS2_9ACTN
MAILAVTEDLPGDSFDEAIIVSDSGRRAAQQDARLYFGQARIVAMKAPSDEAKLAMCLVDAP